MAAQAPTTPDLSFVKDLQPGVAYAVLAVIALGIVAFYLGPGIKARFTPKPPDPPAKPAEATAPVAVPSLPAAMDRADVVSQQFLDHVLRQLRDSEADRERLERENRDLRFELDRARWQRGMS